MATEHMGLEDAEEIGRALRSVSLEAKEAVERLAERLEIERRMREQPLTVLAVAAGAGFVLGGGLWPAVRPLVKAAIRAALSPANLLAVGAALGAIRAAEERRASEGTSPGTVSH